MDRSAVGFQSTPPGWEATNNGGRQNYDSEISIHASRVGGDIARERETDGNADFNPRLPGGRRPGLAPRPSDLYLFQSTPPGWEATFEIPTIAPLLSFQSTPPGWEATLGENRESECGYHFNPRLPGGRRPTALEALCTAAAFQSTPPGWEATFAVPVRVS